MKKMNKFPFFPPHFPTSNIILYSKKSLFSSSFTSLPLYSNEGSVYCIRNRFILHVMPRTPIVLVLFPMRTSILENNDGKIRKSDQNLTDPPTIGLLCVFLLSSSIPLPWCSFFNTIRQNYDHSRRLSFNCFY
jgi:hypothetical protein